MHLIGAKVCVLIPYIPRPTNYASGELNETYSTISRQREDRETGFGNQESVAVMQVKEVMMVMFVTLVAFFEKVTAMGMVTMMVMVMVTMMVMVRVTAMMTVTVTVCSE